MQKQLPELPYRRQLLHLSDGGLVALDWLNEQQEPPVVLFLTGLSSGSQAYYFKNAVPLIAKMNCPCVVLNNRGQGGLPLTNHKLVSALSTDDVAEASCWFAVVWFMVQLFVSQGFAVSPITEVLLAYGR